MHDLPEVIDGIFFHIVYGNEWTNERTKRNITTKKEREQKRDV